MEKWLEITPHCPSFKKLVVFWLFSMQCKKSNPSDFFDEVCGNNEDMKTDLQRLQGRCLGTCNPGREGLVPPWKINGWNPKSWRFGSDDFPFQFV